MRQILRRRGAGLVEEEGEDGWFIQEPSGFRGERVYLIISFPAIIPGAEKEVTNLWLRRNLGSVPFKLG